MHYVNKEGSVGTYHSAICFSSLHNIQKLLRVAMREIHMQKMHMKKISNKPATNK